MLFFSIVNFIVVYFPLPICSVTRRIALLVILHPPSRRDLSDRMRKRIRILPEIVGDSFFRPSLRFFHQTRTKTHASNSTLHPNPALASNRAKQNDRHRFPFVDLRRAFAAAES